jgi:hypothetical protein
MVIYKDEKNNDPIRTTDEWFSKCPPQGKLKHWVDGRSAKETAKHWINGAPTEFLNLVKPLGVCIDVVSPEHVTHFDKNGGNGRNHDLLILDQANKIVIGIESKVDESFGDTISEKIIDSEKEFKKNPNSKALQRIKDLRKAVFGKLDDKQLELRYQLLHGIAGVVAEAGIRKYSKALFVVQTFLSKEMDSVKHRTNQRDLDRFIEYLSKGQHKIIHNGDLLQIGQLPGNEFVARDIELYIGKIDIKI